VFSLGELFGYGFNPNCCSFVLDSEAWSWFSWSWDEDVKGLNVVIGAGYNKVWIFEPTTGFIFLYVGHVWIEGVSNRLSIELDSVWLQPMLGLCGRSVMELGGHWLKLWEECFEIMFMVAFLFDGLWCISSILVLDVKWWFGEDPLMIITMNSKKLIHSEFGEGNSMMWKITLML
jgi:hypothetical protein